ncbi:hypothetical protein Nepgr_011139 [Nepenthes gracilis]|uniref:Secreted protein n=1 Tax=Nepenthes gracilis TaxID=150966 RepID=A0AAD3XLP0_NEPGR|nr:hypothetical protein Nepgr_011139 [Nepenthes gracilis]
MASTQTITVLLLAFLLAFPSSGNGARYRLCGFIIDGETGYNHRRHHFRAVPSALGFLPKGIRFAPSAPSQRHNGDAAVYDRPVSSVPEFS